MRVVILPSGKDPDEAARENPVALKKAIKEAIPIYDYFISSAMKRFDGATAFGKKKIGEELAPILAKIENPIVQGHYVKKLAGVLDASESAVDEMVRRAARGNVFQTEKPAGAPPASGDRDEKLETYVLALLLQGNTAELPIPADFSNPAIKKIIEQLKEFLKKNTNLPAGRQVFLIKDFADSLPPELIPTLDEAFLWDIGDFIENEELFAREWDAAVRALDRAGVKKAIQAEKDYDKLRALTDRLKALEKEG